MVRVSAATVDWEPSARRAWRERAARLALAVFLVGFLLDPGGGLGLKYAVSLVAVAAAILTRGPLVPMSFLWLEFPLFMVLPAVAAVGGAMADADPAEIWGAVSFALTWAVFPVALLLRRDVLLRIFSSVMLWGALLYIAIFALLYWLIFSNQLAAIKSISALATQFRVGYFGINPNTDESASPIPNVYFRWALLLVPAVVLAAGQSWRRKSVLAIAAMSTLSAGVIIFGALGALLGYVSESLAKPRRFIVACAIVCTLALSGGALVQIVGNDNIANLIVDKFSGSNRSTSVKMRHAESIYMAVADQPLKILFGMGPGTEFYSTGRNRMTVTVEVSHLNMIRQFGIVYFALFAAYVGGVLVCLWQSDRNGRLLAIGIAMLFCAAGTNPLLLSPVFFIPLILGRAYITNDFRGERP